MAKGKKKKKRKPVTNPTLFVLEGSPRYYTEGTLFELYTQITQMEWEIITEESIKYHMFVSCLKDTAYPLLKEIWTEDDEWWLVQLSETIKQIKNIDPMATIRTNSETIKASYIEMMTRNGQAIVEQIQQFKAMSISDPATPISNL